MDMEGSPVSSIKDLSELTKLTYLNVNASQINEVEIPDFLQKRPDVSIIYRSETLSKWWEGIDLDWKKLLSDKFKLSEAPTTEELHQLTSVSSLVLERI
jgi:hypothetical protein